jgi:hypothetical protein
VYGINPFLEAVIISEYLREHSKKSDQIAILGSEPEILFESHRDTCTTYLYTYGLVEKQRLARQMQEEMIDQIESAKPKYILFVNVSYSWAPENNERLIFDWANHYLETNYRLVGFIDIRRHSTTVRWDDEALIPAEESRSNLQLYLRNKD